MCGGGGGSNVEVRVPRPRPPLDPAPSIAPVIPVQKTVAPPVSLKRETEEVGVRPKKTERERERLAIRQGTSSLRIPLNTGAGGISGGLNA